MVLKLWGKQNSFKGDNRKAKLGIAPILTRDTPSWPDTCIYVCQILSKYLNVY